MKLVQKTDGNKIFQRKDGRYAVKGKKGQPVNGEEKMAILLAAGLVAKPAPKAEPEPEAVEEVAEIAEETDGDEAKEESAE